MPAVTEDQGDGDRLRAMTGSKVAGRSTQQLLELVVHVQLLEDSFNEPTRTIGAPWSWRPLRRVPSVACRDAIGGSPGQQGGAPASPRPRAVSESRTDVAWAFDVTPWALLELERGRQLLRLHGRCQLRSPTAWAPCSVATTAPVDTDPRLELSMSIT
jgi:hypothetical protein